MSTTRSEDFEILVQATLRINSTEDLESMCRNIIVGACEVTRSEGAALMLIDERTGNLKWFSVLGGGGDLIVDYDLSPGEGFAGWVARAGQSVMSNEPASDPRFCSRIDALSGFTTQSLVCVPLLAHGKIIGVLEVINRAEGQPYSDLDVRKAQAFASLSAAALENSRLIRLAEEIGNVREISRFKNDMVSVVAQEIRNPLTSIRGFAEIIADEDVEPDRRLEYAARVLDEAVRTERLLDGFLSLSRLESGQIPIREERVALHEVLAQCSSRHQDPEHEVRVLAPDGEGMYVLGDRERIGQIIDHLLCNAVNYSPAGGPVTLKAIRRGSDWRVSVTDRGLGIPAECMSRLFHHFYRVPSAAHMKQPGSGLGLTVVKTLVEKMNGRLGVESDAERGTTFWFTLPAVV